MNRALFAGWLLVGTLDIVEVIVFYLFRGVRPMRILQSVASGLLGRDAYSGGVATALLGLALHFLIAFVVVAVYHFASRRLPVLVRYPIVMGTLYGLAVWAVMNLIVVPASAFPRPGMPSGAVLANVLFAHIVCIGIPTALTARMAHQ
jgi:hypothetical protein